MAIPGPALAEGGARAALPTVATIPAMDDADRRERAQARQSRALLRKGRLQSREEDLSPIRGADAVGLVRRLTAESWSLAGLEAPSYTRDRIPWRFLPGRSA
jgi:hypothetical protein